MPPSSDDPVFRIKQGDQRPKFVVVLYDDFGEPSQAVVDLTDASSAVFNMRHESGAVIIDGVAADITNDVGGEVTYTWDVGDTAEVGFYQAEVEITWTDTLPETWPNKGFWWIEVTEAIS